MKQCQINIRVCTSNILFMNPKYKSILILFLIANAVTLLGALFKIMHYPFSNLMLIFGISLEIYTIIKLVFTLTKKE